MFDDTYDQAEDAVQAVKATADDVDSLTILISKNIAGLDDEDLSDVGMILHYCNGSHGYISRSLTVLLLNDGVFGRLKLPVQFI